MSGFGAGDAAKCSGSDDGAECLRAESQRHDTGGNGGRRTARRAARRAIRAVGVDRWSRLSPGKFRGHCLAYDIGSQFAQFLHEAGIVVWHVALVDGRAVGCFKESRVVKVLDADRKSIEWKPGLRSERFGIENGEGSETWIATLRGLPAQRYLLVLTCIT